LARSVGPWVFWIFLLFSVYLLVENEIIMNALNKTKEDLLIELQKLQKEYFAFKEKYEKDIGNHMGVEEKLTISETNYRRLFETAKDGIIILDAETGMITDVNPFLVELLGYRKEKFLEKAIWDIGFFKDIVANHDKFIELKQKGYVRYDDLPLESIAGRKIRVEFVSNVYPVNHHMVIQCNIRDITERKTTEEELLQEQSLMFALMDNLPDHIYFKDRESRFLRNNKAHVLSFGLTDSDQLVGKSDFDFFTKDVAQRQYNDEQEVIRTGHPINKVEFTIRKDNSVNWYYSTKMPLRDKERKIIGTFGISRDITDRKLAEQELLVAKERAEESDRLKSAFLANMSHEIRTPMNGILGFADLLKEPHLTEEEQQEYISVIKKSGKRMLNIIDDIVNISKIESGQLEVSISEIDVNQQIEFLWTFFKPESERKGLQLTVKNMLPSKECRIKTDRKKFLAILTNLVNNAIKFTRIGSIEFGVEKKGDFLEFFVKDTGIGVSEHQKEIIFERFRQGSEAHNRTYEGAGLGLSIAKAYVEMLGGKIWLESTPGDGSTFHFTLPNNALREEKTEMKEIFQGIKANDKPKTLKILVADDDEMSRELIVTVFKKPANEILQVQTGIEAVEACRNNPDLDIVLMDIKMPDLDGYEATRQIRQFNKNVIIIAQTAYAMTGDRERAIEAGCNDYISKPITIDVLNGLKQKYFN